MDELARHIARLRVPDANLPAHEVSPNAAVENARGLPGMPHRSAYGPFHWRYLAASDLGRGLPAVERRLNAGAFPSPSPGNEASIPLSKAVFFDLETCGFSGAPLFLIGLARRDGGPWAIEQFFARGYEEEAGVLGAFLERLSQAEMLVTFNGRSFDWPFALDRLARHRMPIPPALPHLDLLHRARRQWSGRFPNYRLQTLESMVCKRRRVADLGGRDIPIAYHEYIRTGQLRDIRRILEHNALDVLTMLELTAALLDAPVAQASVPAGFNRGE